MKITLAIALAVAAGTVAPAFAETLQTAASGAAATAVPASAAAKDQARKFCVVDTLTGSRLSKKVCRTRAEWAEEGVSVGGKPD